MKSFFIKKNRLIKILLMTLVVLNFFNYILIILWCLFVFLYFVIHRKNKIDFKEVLNIDPDVILSPIDGVVEEIIYNINDEFHGVSGTKVRFNMTHLNRPGILLPVGGSILNKEDYDGKTFFRYGSNLNFSNGYHRSNITIKTKQEKIIYLEFLKCPFGMNARTWIQPGDKGKLASCIGFVPLGGTALMTVPSDSELFIKVGDKVTAGATVISGLKDKI